MESIDSTLYSGSVGAEVQIRHRETIYNIDATGSRLILIDLTGPSHSSQKSWVTGLKLTSPDRIFVNRPSN